MMIISEAHNKQRANNFREKEMKKLVSNSSINNKTVECKANSHKYICMGMAVLHEVNIFPFTIYSIYYSLHGLTYKKFHFLYK